MQKMVGLVACAGSILVGVANWFQTVIGMRVDLVESFISTYTGFMLALALAMLALGFWDHAIARWGHIILLVFSGVFSALTANQGNFTSAFFVIFAMILLAEYGIRRPVAYAAAAFMLGAYFAALSLGYRDDVELPVVSALGSLTAVVTFVGLFGGVVLLHRAQLRQDAAMLEERIRKRTHDLNEALSERNVMVQEIHHRVKNNMQTISTLLAMEAEKMPGSQATSALEASQQRIRAMASVHDVLYRSERLDRVNLAEYTRDLVDTLLQMAIGPVDLDLRVADAGTVDLSFAVSLGLVLNELVSNALKHAFVRGRPGRLRVDLSADAEVITLVVEDNGRGLPEGFSPRDSHGVGMNVITSIVRHGQGSMTFESDGGTTWRLEFPLRSESR